MSEYLSGAALYRAFADMLEGGREVQRRSPNQDEWFMAEGIISGHYEYRLEPEPKKTVTVYTKDGPMDMPAPMREAPVGSFYWITDTDGDVFREKFLRYIDKHRLKDGNCHHTEEDAKAWADFQAKQRRGHD